MEQNVDVSMPQVMKDTLETMEDTPKERISECTPEHFFDAFDEPVPRFRDDPMVKQKLQAEAKEINNQKRKVRESCRFCSPHTELLRPAVQVRSGCVR